MAHKLKGIVLSQKKKEIMPLAATWMNLEMINVGEVSQTERQVYQISRAEQNWTQGTICKTDTPHRQSPGGWSPRPESGRGEDWEVQTRPCRSEQPGPTVGHRSCAHSPGTDHSGEGRAEHMELGRRAAQGGCAGLQHNAANRLGSSEGCLRSSL